MLFQSKCRTKTTIGENELTVACYGLQVENLQPATCNLQQYSNDCLNNIPFTKLNL